MLVHNGFDALVFSLGVSGFLITSQSLDLEVIMDEAGQRHDDGCDYGDIEAG